MVLTFDDLYQCISVVTFDLCIVFFTTLVDHSNLTPMNFRSFFIVWICGLVLVGQFSTAVAEEEHNTHAPLSHRSKSLNQSFILLTVVASSSPALSEVAPLMCEFQNLACPSTFPVCCGLANMFFCIPGGRHCCSSNSRNGVSCSNSELCCALLNQTKCCPRSSRCGSEIIDGEEKLACIEHKPESKALKCSKSQTADECQQDNECGWCCQERKCIALQESDEDDATLLQSKPLHRSMPKCPLSGAHPLQNFTHCPSVCSHYSTCSSCTAHGSQTTGEESCVWCLSTMSCIPKELAVTCPNLQDVRSPSHCTLAGYYSPSRDRGVPYILKSIGYVFLMFFLILFFWQLWRFVHVPHSVDVSAFSRRGVRHYGFLSFRCQNASAKERCRMKCEQCRKVLSVDLSTGKVGDDSVGEPVASAPTSPDAELSNSEVSKNHFIALLPCQHLFCTECAEYCLQASIWRKIIFRLRSLWRRIMLRRSHSFSALPHIEDEVHLVRLQPQFQHSVQLISESHRCPICNTAVTDVFVADCLKQV